jgi:hypothetical protein
MMNNKDLKAIAIGCAYKIYQHARKTERNIFFHGIVTFRLPLYQRGRHNLEML